MTRAGVLAGLLAVIVGVVPVAAPTLASAADDGGRIRLPLPGRDWTRWATGTGDDPVAEELEARRELARRWHAVHELVGERHVARLGSDLRRAANPEKGLTAARLREATPENPYVLKVLIVRIGYEGNREPGLNTIAPDGGFDMRTLPDREDTLYVDPPPHGRRYFEMHLEGLREFYHYQSGGRLRIEGQVLPPPGPGGEERWYTLPDIADYGPGRDGIWLADDENLAARGNIIRYVRDMIDAADAGTQADGSANLADHDDDDELTYVIFVHAGSDWQSDLAGDSPNDLPTFFLSLGEPQPLTSIDSETGAPGALSELSLIPETTNQDGWAGSIAAALYHEFGHALGLPDVYDTDTFGPGVGYWDLMDAGTNLRVPVGKLTAEGDTVATLATGVLPPSLGVWCKWYLGWLRMGEIGGGEQDLRLPAVGVPEDQYPLYRTSNIGFNARYPQAYRAGASTRDFFLLENRWVPLGPEETPYNGFAYEQDAETGVILYLAGERAGDWTNSGMYDYFMPAGGLLVWHVNQDRIEQGLPTNSINTDGDGLRIVEADGIQDIGVYNAYVLEPYGSVLDPFHGRRGDDGATNTYTTLGVEGFPSSRGYDRSWTGFSFEDVRDEARSPAVLRFTARVEPLLPDFPWEPAALDTARVSLPDGVPPARGLDPASLAPLVMDDPLAGDAPAPVLVFADAAPAGTDPAAWRPGLHALRASGRPRWVDPAWVTPDGDITAQFAELPAPLAGPPVAWSADDGSGRLLTCDTDGTVTLWTLPARGLPSVAWTAALGAAPLGPPGVLHRDGAPAGVLCAVADGAGGDLVLLDVADGQPLGVGFALAGGLAGPTRAWPRAAGWDRFVVAGADGWLSCGADETSLYSDFAVPWPRTPEGPVRTALVPGVPAHYAAFDDRGLLGAWDLGGTPQAGLYDVGAPLVAEPAVADLDGDGGQDLVVATAARVLAWRGDGAGIRGFPRPLRDLFPLADTTSVAGPLLVADADGNGANDVIFATDAGHLLILGANGDLLPRTPYRWGDGRRGGLAVGPGATDADPRVLWLLSRGGEAGGPLGEQPRHGRLAAYALAPAAERRTSEWLAAGGGALRRGPEGTAAHLEAASPLAAESDRALLYPNPLRGDDLTVRFYSEGGADAVFTVHDLEGEVVRRERFAAAPRTLNEHIVRLPGLASGLYVCRLQWDAPQGRRTRTMTLAVER